MSLFNLELSSGPVNEIEMTVPVVGKPNPALPGWGLIGLGVCPSNRLSQRDRGWGMGRSASRPRGVQETGIREVASLTSFLLVMAERADSTIPLPIS